MFIKWGGKEKMNMWLIVLFLLSGFLIGYFRIFSGKFYRFAEMITTGGLIILLGTMGAKIGIDDRVLRHLDKIGFQAFLVAVASIVGSILLVKLFSSWFKIEIEVTDEKADQYTSEESDHFMTIVIILSVIAGILSGLYIIPHSFFSTLDQITTYALAALLFGVGVDIGKNKEIFVQLMSLGWQIIALPFIIAIGSILGAVSIGFFIGLAFNESAAVGAGFGWYSLSGVILSKVHSVELGSLAFLSNVFRELLTIIILPFVVRYLGRITSIAPGGATAMDVTLPIIKETAGEETVIPAFVSGAVLSFLVPILVPFLISL